MEYVWAFLVGGAICVAGQALIDFTKLTPARILVLFVTLGVALTAVGLYDPLVEFAGAGATVPLTGFGYLMAKGVEEAVAEKGLFGAFSGGLSPCFPNQGTKADRARATRGVPAQKKGRRLAKPPPLLNGRFDRSLLNRAVQVMLQLLLVLPLLFKKQENGNRGSGQGCDCRNHGDKYGESTFFQIRHLRLTTMMDRAL